MSEKHSVICEKVIEKPLIYITYTIKHYVHGYLSGVFIIIIMLRITL